MFKKNRLVNSQIPPQLLRSLTVSDGCLVAKVANEFEAKLTVMSFEPTSPWRLLDLAITVNDPGSPVGDMNLVHRRQLDFLCQYLQNRLLAVDEGEHPLVILYNMLHSFCLSLQLELLLDHANQLVRLRYTEGISVSRQSPRSLTLTYWSVPLVSSMSASSVPSGSQATQIFSLTVAVNDTKPFLMVDHVPAAPKAPKVVRPTRLNMYWLLGQTLHCRAQNMLERLMSSIRAVENDEGIVACGGAVTLQCTSADGNMLRPILRIDLVTANGPADQVVEVALDARRGTLRCTNPVLPRQSLSDLESAFRHFTFPPPPSTSLSTPMALPALFFSSISSARTTIMLTRLLASAKRLGLPARIASHFRPISRLGPKTTNEMEQDSSSSLSESLPQQALWIPIGVPSVRLSAAFTQSKLSSGLANICLHQLDTVGDDFSSRLSEWYAIQDRRQPSSSGYVCSKLNLDTVLATTYASSSSGCGTTEQRQTNKTSSTTDLMLAHRQLVVSMAFCQQRANLASLEMSLKKLGFHSAGISVDWATGQQSLLLTGLATAPAPLLSRDLELRLVSCRISWELPRSERWLVQACLASSLPIPPSLLSPAYNDQKCKHSRLSNYLPIVFHLDPPSGNQTTQSSHFDRAATLISYTLDAAAHLLTLLAPLTSSDAITSIEIQSQRASVSLRYHNDEKENHSISLSVSRTPVPISGTSISAVVSWHYSLVFGPGSPHVAMRQIYYSWFSRTLDFPGMLYLLEETHALASCLRQLSSQATFIPLPITSDGSKTGANGLGGVSSPQQQQQQPQTGNMLVPSVVLVPMSPVLIRLIYQGCLSLSVTALPGRMVHLQYCPGGVPSIDPVISNSRTGQAERGGATPAFPQGHVLKILNAVFMKSKQLPVEGNREGLELTKPDGSVVLTAERFNNVVSSGLFESLFNNVLAFYSLEQALTDPNGPSASISMGSLPFSCKRQQSGADVSETQPLVLANAVVQVTVAPHLNKTIEISSSPADADGTSELPSLFFHDCQILDEYVARDYQISSEASALTRLSSLLRILSQPLPVIRDFLSLMELALKPESSAGCRLWLPLTQTSGKNKTPVICQSPQRIQFMVDLFKNIPPTQQQQQVSEQPLRLQAIYDASTQAFMVHLIPEQPAGQQINTAAVQDQLSHLLQRAVQQATANRQTPLFPVLSDIAANMRLG